MKRVVYLPVLILFVAGCPKSVMENSAYPPVPGSIAPWGSNARGQCNVSMPNEGFKAFSAGAAVSFGIRADGSIEAWGWNMYGQCDVPTPNKGFVAIACGSAHSLAIRVDGSIAAWGKNEEQQCDVPSLNEDFIDVTGGYEFSVGLKADGTIVAWGLDENGFGYVTGIPEPDSNFIAVDAGHVYCLALRGP